jgi:hypothetical protein
MMDHLRPRSLQRKDAPVENTTATASDAGEEEVDAGGKLAAGILLVHLRPATRGRLRIAGDARRPIGCSVTTSSKQEEARYGTLSRRLLIVSSVS